MNARYFPEPSSHALRKAKDLSILPFGELANLAEDIPPVKVSIPLSQLSKTEKVYQPHRRQSYDPQDSVDIAAVNLIYLFNNFFKKIFL